MKRPKCSTSHDILGKTKYEKELEKYIDYLEQKVAINTDNIDLVSGCFPTDDQIRMLSSQYAEDENSSWANDYNGYNNGMKECIEITKKNLNNR